MLEAWKDKGRGNTMGPRDLVLIIQQARGAALAFDVQTLEAKAWERRVEAGRALPLPDAPSAIPPPPSPALGGQQPINASLHFMRQGVNLFNYGGDSSILS